MRRAGVVVLSAHLDDACFSIGALLQALGGGALLNVFNRSTYLARLPAGLEPPVPEVVVAACREAEDTAFARQVGLRRTSLGGAEPGFAGRRPNDLSGLEQDIAQMGAPLLQALSEHQRGDGTRPYLLTPMAIGRHVNHHAVHQIVARAQAQLQPHFRVCFYEDLPYAHDPLERWRGLRRFQQGHQAGAWSRCVFTPSVQDKLALVSLYATQLKRDPAPWKFRPASLWPAQLHEAVWMPADA